VSLWSSGTRWVLMVLYGSGGGRRSLSGCRGRRCIAGRRHTGTAGWPGWARGHVNVNVLDYVATASARRPRRSGLPTSDRRCIEAGFDRRELPKAGVAFVRSVRVRLPCWTGKSRLVSALQTIVLTASRRIEPDGRAAPPQP